MWNEKWFGDWFGGWFDNSEEEEEFVDLFAGLTVKEEVYGSSGGGYSYIGEEEEEPESEILAICNAFLICH